MHTKLTVVELNIVGLLSSVLQLLSSLMCLSAFEKPHLYVLIYKKRHSNSILSNGQDDTMISIYHTNNTWLCTQKYRKKKRGKVLNYRPPDMGSTYSLWCRTCSHGVNNRTQCVVSLSFTYNLARKVRDRKKKRDWQRSEWKENNRNHLKKKKKGRKRPEEESHPNSTAATTELKPLLP